MSRKKKTRPRSMGRPRGMTDILYVKTDESADEIIHVASSNLFDIIDDDGEETHYGVYKLIGIHAARKVVKTGA